VVPTHSARHKLALGKLQGALDEAFMKPKWSDCVTQQVLCQKCGAMVEVKWRQPAR
jgi:hypothetical protein